LSIETLVMQGGAKEDLVHLKKVGKACDACRKDRKKDEPVTPPLDTLKVEPEIFVSPTADALLLKARELFATCVALPIAWLHLDADVESSRSRKHERVKEGAEIVCQLQQRLRTKLLDKYFLVWSFFAEEEFYLLSLPLLFWCGDYRFARHMTYVVCWGLLWGNLLKDVFRLPRPKNVKAEVWVPHSASQIDSTACRDFGFPSTHAMNSISNSLFALLFYLSHPWIDGTAMIAMVFGMCFWISSISLGRLYLGVHSPMDVKGGLLLGFAVAIMAGPLQVCNAFDQFMLQTPYVALWLLVMVVLVLVLNPQPRPMTPTFMQNCTLCGLILGAAVGFRTEMDRRGQPSLHESSLGQIVLRVVLGYSMLLLARIILKRLLSELLGAFGFEANPAKPVSKDKPRSGIKGWDLFAAAFMKTTVYAVMAWTIVCGAPAVFEALKMPCSMNG